MNETNEFPGFMASKLNIVRHAANNAVRGRRNQAKAAHSNVLVSNVIWRSAATKSKTNVLCNV